MSEEARKSEYTPLNLHPFVGLDLGERWGREVGELSQRLTHVEQAVGRLEARFDAFEAKVEARFKALEAKFDELARMVARHEEKFISLEKRLDDKFISLEKRLDNNARLMIGLFTALFVAIIAQKLL